MLSLTGARGFGRVVGDLEQLGSVRQITAGHIRIISVDRRPDHRDDFVTAQLVGRQTSRSSKMAAKEATTVAARTSLAQVTDGRLNRISAQVGHERYRRIEYCENDQGGIDIDAHSDTHVRAYTSITPLISRQFRAALHGFSSA